MEVIKMYGQRVAEPMARTTMCGTSFEGDTALRSLSSATLAAPPQRVSFGKPVATLGAVNQQFVQAAGATARPAASLQPPAEGGRAELERVLSAWALDERRKARHSDLGPVEDSDGEQVRLCCHCRLPVGDLGYAGDCREHVLHAECMAEHVQQKMARDEDTRRRKDAEIKQARHAEYGIGWKPELALGAGRFAAAKLLQCQTAPPEGMCCLVLDRQSTALRVAPTVEPAASLDLDYLAVALQVRRREGREPWFSLDPTDPPSDGGQVGSWQVKRFEPSWLAGTCVGEVMFQADYHLKELSMGECAQPVIGMKSCLENCEAEERDAAWNAREWFVLRQAELHLSQDRVLIPHLEMAVEAREQVRTRNGLEDALITRPSHPLVKYAECFTHNFDLIAERKSVIHQLREVAKASIVAKFLVDADAGLDDAWFDPAGQATPGADSCLRVPQLWNDRSYAEICVKDGAIVDADEGIRKDGRGLYGGIEFGLDKMIPSKITQAMFAPAGVDLSLDQFSLCAPGKATLPVRALDGTAEAPGACAGLGRAFWSGISNESESAFSRDDKALFSAVFNPYLSDRRSEGEKFTPPSTSLPHLKSLRRLVKEEESVREQRKSHFFSGKFVVGDAGGLFPLSWSDSFRVTRRGGGERAGETAVDVERSRAGALCPRPDLLGAGTRTFDRVLQLAAPSFARATEDGSMFRIYRCSRLEVRTVQEPDGRETVGAVFSIQVPTRAATHPRGIACNDKIVKVTQYVERATPSPSEASIAVSGRPGCRLYVVLETELGATVVTEKLASGTATWEENPQHLADRNAFAKAMFSEDCSGTGVTIEDMKSFSLGASSAGASRSKCKRYAQGIYNKACGRFRRGDRC